MDSVVFTYYTSNGPGVWTPLDLQAPVPGPDAGKRHGGVVFGL